MSTPSFAAIARGKLAVVTGGASGIGLAAAKAFAASGMRIALLDLPGKALRAAADAIDGVTGYPCDIADAGAVAAIAAEITQRDGPASVLMNNAGIGGGGDVLAGVEGWSKVLGVNLMGVLHGVHSFVPAMLASGEAGLVINTGSKQGITQPPGNTAYNVSKSAVKSLTEGLAHTLREQAGDRVSAHLLVPGYTFTGMTAGGATEKPGAAWTPEQVIGFMLHGLERGDFYIICPDNETTPEQDRKRVAWGAADITENRPALSRWHPAWKERFARHMEE